MKEGFKDSNTYPMPEPHRELWYPEPQHTSLIKGPPCHAEVSQQRVCSKKHPSKTAASASFSGSINFLQINRIQLKLIYSLDPLHICLQRLVQGELWKDWGNMLLKVLLATRNQCYKHCHMLTFSSAKQTSYTFLCLKSPHTYQ